MPPIRLFDRQGKPVATGKELGRGGEGAVFDIISRPHSVAKVYLKPPNAEHAAKLAAMVGVGNAGLLKVAAWPTETLHDPAGAVVGFAMPKVGGHEPIFKLYGPRQRLQEFPKADWRFLIHAAANAARAFSLVHSTGLVIGDVNHGNLVVAQDATVRMIDCDSFQLSSGSKTWFCTVGVGTHQPPEMQGRDSYAGILRTPNHDNFGLAVIVFQLLCMARHPFAGRFAGSGEPPSIEEAIAASRYAYSRDRTRTKLEPPPGSLPVGALTSDIQDLLERAFAPGAERTGRPIAQQWVRALEDLGSNLKACRTNAAHFYKTSLKACPWCAIEGATGVTLFPVVFIPGVGGTGGMAALWQEFGRLGEPVALGPVPSTPVSNGKPSSEAQKAAKDGKGLRLAAWASVAASAALTLAVAPVAFRPLMAGAEGVLAFLIHRHGKSNGPGPFRTRLNAVQQEWIALERAWLAPNSSVDVPQLRTAIARAKAEYDGLPGEQAKRMQVLFERRRNKQIEEHLDRFSLANAKIPGIGPTKVATLASHGITTAGDIVASRVLLIPGFGPSTAAKLTAWRRTREATFTFDPNRGVAASDQAIVERDISIRKTALERDVSMNLGRLKTALAGATTLHQALHGKAAELEPLYAQALADVAAAPGGRQTHIRLLTLSILVTLIAALSAIPSLLTTAPSFRNPGPTSSSSPMPQLPVLKPAPPVESAARLSTEGQPSTTGVTTAPITPIQSRPPFQPGAHPSAPIGIEKVAVKMSANVRVSADSNAQVLRTVPQGAILRVFNRSAGWVQVGEDEPWGWIFSGLVEKIP